MLQPNTLRPAPQSRHRLSVIGTRLKHAVSYQSIKRLIDLAGAIGLFISLLPVFIITWFAVRLTSRGPGLFWSKRVGRYGKIIAIPKFRTMRINAPITPREAMDSAENHVTIIGDFLRKTSIDEIPQLYSIIIGEMSFIGPRPLIPSDPAISCRLNYPAIYKTRPGISGLAQILGRNFVSPERKARLDAFYSHKIGPQIDFKILVSTIKILFTREGVM